MDPYWQGENVTVYHGDCIPTMAALPPDSVDAIVTDPPYGLEFMGKEWDSFKTGRAANYQAGGSLDVEQMAAQSGKGGAGPSYVNRPAKRCANCGKQAWSGSPCRCDPPAWVMDNSPLHSFGEWCLAWTTEALRVLKPGGHLLAFGGTRTWHRLAVAIEDAGFEIRDSIAWLYGSGFPKSLDVSKAIDKAAGAQREVTGSATGARNGNGQNIDYGSFGSAADGSYDITAPATEAARQWAGWGTALKPAFEPIVFARKPLVGTVAANVLTHGTGALNIDGCRIAGEVPRTGQGVSANQGDIYHAGINKPGVREFVPNGGGRWPANVVLDADQAATLNKQSGATVSPTTGRQGKGAYGTGTTYGSGAGLVPGEEFAGYGDSGGAARFFYVAKAPTAERPKQGGIAHPTVKPIDLMQWLVRLVTPPGGVVLDPFAGSGTTGEATIREGFESILIEREAEYLPLIRERFQRPINYLLEFE